MPYLIRHTKSGKYEVVKRNDGTVAAQSKTLAGARGFIFHAMKNEPKPERKKREPKSK